MYYVFDVCPKCMDKLYERKPMDDEEEWRPISESCCPNCGHRLIEACAGEKNQTVWYIMRPIRFFGLIFRQTVMKRIRKDLQKRQSI